MKNHRFSSARGGCIPLSVTAEDMGEGEGMPRGLREGRATADRAAGTQRIKGAEGLQG